MAEERYTSKFEICLRDVSKADAWMLTYIMVHMLKDPACIRDIYQMLTGDDTHNDVDADRAIDFILLDSLSNGGRHPSKIIRLKGINTESELVNWIYTRDIGDLDCKVYRLGMSALADIAAYMNIRNIIPKDSDMSDVISHFMKGAKAAEALRIANAKYRKYMEGHKND